jgi:hypothetical protein
MRNRIFNTLVLPRFHRTKRLIASMCGPFLLVAIEALVNREIGSSLEFCPLEVVCHLTHPFVEPNRNITPLTPLLYHTKLSNASLFKNNRSPYFKGFSRVFPARSLLPLMVLTPKDGRRGGYHPPEPRTPEPRAPEPRTHTSHAYPHPQHYSP